MDVKVGDRPQKWRRHRRRVKEQPPPVEGLDLEECETEEHNLIGACGNEQEERKCGIIENNHVPLRRDIDNPAPLLKEQEIHELISSARIQTKKHVAEVGPIREVAAGNLVKEHRPRNRRKNKAMQTDRTNNEFHPAGGNQKIAPDLNRKASAPEVKSGKVSSSPAVARHIDIQSTAAATSLASSKISLSTPKALQTCSLCGDECEADKEIVISCDHSFCSTCVSDYFNVCSSSIHDTKEITFKHLFCPFRCGSQFISSRYLPPAVQSIIEGTMSLMRKAEELALALLIKSNEFDGSKTQNLAAFALEKYSIYRCYTCKDIFPLRKLCGVAGDADEHIGEKHYCSSCTQVGGERQMLSIYKPTAKKDNEIGSDITAEEIYLCDSDDTAVMQQLELEVIGAMYGDELTVLVPPPSIAGEPCARVKLRAPRLYSLDINPVFQSSKDSSMKLISQISFEFFFTAGYPNNSSPVLNISTGNLSLAEMNLWTADSLNSAMREAVNVVEFPCISDFGSIYVFNNVVEYPCSVYIKLLFTIYGIYGVCMPFCFLFSVFCCCMIFSLSRQNEMKCRLYYISVYHNFTFRKGNRFEYLANR